ncbi:MAG: cytochrome c family protein [bacterium]|nr:cytochrome c family protein [bacterium]
MRILNLQATLWGSFTLALVATNLPVMTPPTDIQQPGTQPLQATSMMGTSAACTGCHGGYDQVVEPGENWMGSMMAHSSRDPVYYAALAIAEGDFPGAGDYCIRCHSQRAWHQGRATPTDGSGLDPNQDMDGVECAICHNMVDQDMQEHAGLQTAPFIANDGGSPPEGYYGSGMVVLAGDFVRHGPYRTTTATHAYVQSEYLRSSKMCGTCHDVSNPLVGDLAPNNGAQVPLQPGTFSGVPNSPVAGKAAFNNFPFQYGIVERTFSEHMASALSTTPVSTYPSLPADLQRGAIKRAYDQALLAGNGGDYEDRTQRFFTCQTCHMEPVVGEGAAFGLAPLRYDLPAHDLTGGNTWVPKAIQWLDGQNRMTFGGGLTATQNAAMDRGVLRARANLKRAGALDVTDDTVRVTNLTGHKLISGYPEGRRMWLRVRWRDEQNNLIAEEGTYESFNSNVAGTNYTVHSITDPNARVYEAKLGISQDWALQLLTLGVSPTLPLSYDPVTGAVEKTLIQLAGDPAGTVHETFHFVLNNTLVADNRIPPYGFAYNEAQTRNALPVPATQYGNPGPNGTYDYFDDVQLSPPAGATRAEIELLYQTASWEYIQFLRLANPGTSPHLASAGLDLFDAWRNTGQSAPEQMALARWCDLPGTGEDLELRSSKNGAAADATCGKRLEGGDTVTFEVTSPNNTFATNLGGLVYQVHDASAPPAPAFPGIWLDRIDAQVVLIGATSTPTTGSITIPTWYSGMIRAQAIMLSSTANNGIYAASAALDVWVE